MADDELEWEQSIRDAEEFWDARTLWMEHRTRLPGESDTEMGMRMLAEIDALHGSWQPLDFQEAIEANRGNDVPTTFVFEGQTYSAPISFPAGDDIDGADAESLLIESGENQQVDLADLGIEDGISFDDFFSGGGHL